MLISLFFVIFFIIIFIILVIFGGNYVLRSVVDSFLQDGPQEHFENKEKDITDLDECRKIDQLSEDKLQFQTASNIPLTPIPDEFYVNELLEFKKSDYDVYPDLQKGKQCMKIPKLLYDGIWYPDLKQKNGNEIYNWKLTNGDISENSYCSNKMLEINKPIPKDFKDLSATPCVEGGEYYTYFNDAVDDKFDYEVKCFPEVFNAGIY